MAKHANLKTAIIKGATNFSVICNYGTPWRGA